MTSSSLHAWRTLLIASIACGLLACDPGDDPGNAAPPDEGGTTTVEIALVNAYDWSQVAMDSDPFRAERPDDASCASGFQVEAGVFEVETDLCSWGTFQQPLLANVSAGTPLRIIAWHLPLWAPEPAEGVLRLQVGDQPIWELTVPIPLGAMLYDEEIPAPVDLYADDPVTLHIHNHGTNSWRFAVFHALEEG